MTSPIDPVLCKNTGRLLTEWFEYPEFTEDEIKAMALKEAGVDELAHKHPAQMTPDEREAFNKYTNFVNKFKRRKWGYRNMDRQEVAARLNEATKMVDPDNFKFLDEATRERTGLEINPLWLMECMVRSGTLGPKETLAALKELAQYTHSKAPQINQNTNINSSEAWLLELSSSDYQTVDANPSFQPKTAREKGMGPEFEKRRVARVQLMADTQEYQNTSMIELAEELGDFKFDDDAEQE